MRRGGCLRCGGSAHRLAPDNVWHPSFFLHGWQRHQSYWCISCMEEEWPASRLDGCYGLFWKLVSSEEVGVRGTAGGRRYRGFMGAPYRLGFPSVIFPIFLPLAGPCNFLLSPLGALKEMHYRAPLDFEPAWENWAVLAVIVPWERVILRADLVLQGDLFTPLLPVAALEIRRIARQGLTPTEASSYLDALPDSVAWMKVQHWENRLRPELPNGWQRRIHAAEGLAQGLAPLRSITTTDFLSPHDRPASLRSAWERQAVHADRQEQVESQERLKRFLGVLAQQLFSDRDREIRYQRYRSSKRSAAQARGAKEILLWDPKRQRMEGHFNPWRDLEALMEVLREDEVDAWVAAIEQAVQAL
jgi:hypothetical protein